MRSGASVCQLLAEFAPGRGLRMVAGLVDAGHLEPFAKDSGGEDAGEIGAERCREIGIVGRRPVASRPRPAGSGRYPARDLHLDRVDTVLRLAVMASGPAALETAVEDAGAADARGLDGVAQRRIAGRSAVRAEVKLGQRTLEQTRHATRIEWPS